MSVKIQIRKDTAANWTSYNPILASGEQGYETDTNKMKIGNGTSDWNTLPYLVADVTVPTSVFDLDDVVLFQVEADGQILAYNSGAGGFVNITANSDIVPEGTTNLYFTNQRAIDAINGSSTDFLVLGEWTFENALVADARGKGKPIQFYGDAYGNIAEFYRDNQSGNSSRSVFKGITVYNDNVNGGKGVSWNSRLETADIGAFDIGEISFAVGAFNDQDNFDAKINLIGYNRVGGATSSQVLMTAEAGDVTIPGQLITNGIQSTGTNNIGDGTGDINLNGPLFIQGTNPAAPTATSDPGTAGELRVATPDGGTTFYLYLYANGLGWLRSQLSTF